MYFEEAICKYLEETIFPQLSPPPYGKIEIHRLVSEKPIYLFVEEGQQLLTVGKSFQYGQIPLEEAWAAAEREFSNLKMIRTKFGMCNDTYNIVAPLGDNKELEALLVTEKASGKLLEHYIVRAINEQRQEKLFRKLGYLAKFFTRLHQNTVTENPVSSTPPQQYLSELLESLRSGLLDSSGVITIEKRAAPWWNKREICEQDFEVIVHGDATPTNFFFYRNEVTGIDLERMRFADRCWDLGFLTAELKHHFLWRTGDRWAAEPFIGHFLREYAVNLDYPRFFPIITAKLPLYMALGLLRIARNIWLGESYRKTLVEEAGLCLEYGL